MCLTEMSGPMPTPATNKYFGYIRVSTVKQGEGVSLQEQRAAIERYAASQRIRISEWFEEKETAAKRGRPVFGKMLSLLKKNRAAGVVIHKIDRSARNLRDWADIGELIDGGIEVHFANEPLDLTSRGGRLSADILAVVAADFIRNNREETKKGFYGRLKQGLYPLNAPLGYIDQGGGKPKAVDPIRGPLIRRAFELYATGSYNLEQLQKLTFDLGLRNKRGRPLSRTGHVTFLRNPFYAGTLRLRTGETFPGVHLPLITRDLFDRVQAVLRNKHGTRRDKHEYLFRRLFKCSTCGYSLVGSRHKGRVYYRCQTRTCPTTSCREDNLSQAIEEAIGAIRFSAEEIQNLESLLPEQRTSAIEIEKAQTTALEQLAGFAAARLIRLESLHRDGSLDQDEYEKHRRAEEAGLARIQTVLRELETADSALLERTPVPSPYLAHPLDLYAAVEPELKRESIRLLTDRRLASASDVVVTPVSLLEGAAAKRYVEMAQQAWAT